MFLREEALIVLQHYFVNKLKTQEGLWPLFVPTETLVLLSRILLRTQENNSLAFSIWQGFSMNLKKSIQGCLTDNNNIPEDEKTLRGEILNLEHLYVLLLIFYTLPRDARLKILADLVAMTSDLQAVHLSKIRSYSTFQLLLSRHLMIVQCMYQNKSLANVKIFAKTLMKLKKP